MEDIKCPSILWFSLLPKNLMYRAIYYAKKNGSLMNEHVSFNDALLTCFDWNLTREGYDFWHEIALSCYE